MCSTSVPGTHKFMKLQFDSLEPRFVHFANGTCRLLKASLLLHHHKRKRYKRFVSKPSILHLFLMVMVFPLILWLYADRLSTGKLEGPQDEVQWNDTLYVSHNPLRFYFQPTSLRPLQQLYSHILWAWSPQMQLRWRQALRADLNIFLLLMQIYNLLHQEQ
jgi:hypothetical protein